MAITKDDLYKNQYDYETLKANIYAVSLLDILKTQKLSADFCVKYILNESFQFLDEDQLINTDMVKKYQPHLSEMDLIEAILRATHKKMMGERIDSIDDFETYMNKHL
jgi:hypothetical protein